MKAATPPPVIAVAQHETVESRTTPVAPRVPTVITPVPMRGRAASRDKSDEQQPSQQGPRSTERDPSPRQGRDLARNDSEFAPEVQVTIGRLEVRTQPAAFPATAAAQHPASKRVSLDDYLSRARR